MEGRPRVVSPEGAGWPEPDFRVPDHGEVARAGGEVVRACGAKIAGELPIDGVAREVGCTSRSSLVRAFLKTYGSPSKFSS